MDGRHGSDDERINYNSEEEEIMTPKETQTDEISFMFAQLVEAAGKNDLKTIKELLRKNDKIIAMEKERQAFMQELIEEQGREKMFDAVLDGDVKRLRLLIDLGVDVNQTAEVSMEEAREDRDFYECRDPLGGRLSELEEDFEDRSEDYYEYHTWTPVSCAVRLDHVECLEVLLAANAYLNKTLFNGYADNDRDIGYHTLTGLALCYERARCLQMLMDHGLDITKEDEDNVFRLALEGGQECLKMVLQQGVCLDRGYCDDAAPGNLDLAVAAGVKPKDAVDESLVPLQQMCRKVIREHLLGINKINLFCRVPKLGLPKIMQKFVLYGQSLEAETE